MTSWSFAMFKAISPYSSCSEEGSFGDETLSKYFATSRFAVFPVRTSLLLKNCKCILSVAIIIVFTFSYKYQWHTKSCINRRNKKCRPRNMVSNTTIILLFQVSHVLEPSLYRLDMNMSRSSGHHRSLL